MDPVPTFQRLVRREGRLDLAQPARLRQRQLPGLSDFSSFVLAPTTTADETSTTTTTTEAPSSTATQPPDTTTTTSEASSSTTTSAETTTTTSSESSTTRTTRDRSSSSTTPPADTTVTNVVTPSTVIVVSSSTITSALDPITSASTRSLSPSEAAAHSGSSSGLSTGAKIGIGVGAGVGGAIALALLVFLCLGPIRRKRNKDDAIVWPAIADSAALYPEPVHNTRAGFGVGDDDELEGHSGGSHGPSMSEVGAGAAGVGAAAGLARYGSTNGGGHSMAPTLPQFPPSVYANEQAYPGGYYGGANDSLAPEGASAYTGYSTQTGSQHSHTPLAPGPASVGYTRSQERHTPSPPRTTAGSASADGHTQEGHLPFPGEPEEELAPGRPLSPTPMQVGDTFGGGYDETEGGRRWRLSVVNNDD
ncbi:hypothetical protein JCM8097_002592 [Rhodosporidiobolus ruineniae]